MSFSWADPFWGLLLCGVVSLGLGFFVYRRDPGGWINRAWLRFSVATAVWAFSVGILHGHVSAGWALGSARVGQVALSLVPGFFLEFVLALLNDVRSRDLLLRWGRRLSALFACLSLTPLILRDVRVEGSSEYFPVAGPFFGPFAIWFIGSFLLSLWILLREYRHHVGGRRNQLRYVILASILGFLSFLSTLPMYFGLSLAPAGHGLLLFYALISYAIVRWRLMDISIVVKNTLIYAGLYSVLVGLFVVVVVFLGQLFFYGPQALDRRVLWMCVVALSIVTAVVRPLDHWLRHWTDQLLFQRKYQWQNTLKEASKGMTKVTSSDHLLKLMAHFIGMRLRVTHVGILQRVGPGFTLKVSRGRDKRPVGLQVDRDSPLLSWLEEKKEILTLDEVKTWLRSERLFPHRTVIRKSLEEVRDQMVFLAAHVCVPAFSKSQMLGLLVLGEKLSGDPFSQEDLDVLSTLANEGAMALENAQLYQQLFQRMGEIEDLYQREHRLFIHTAIALAAAVDARDPYTHGHTERTTAYALSIVDEMITHPEIGEPTHFKQILTVAALLHDIGKIGSPDEILRKRAKLTPREMKKMEEHPVVGAIILQPIKGMEEAAKAVKEHHERYDGRGYPDGLRASEICLTSRIISVADTFDSMTTDRPYRKRLSDAASIEEIQTCSGTQFDPVVVAAFLKAYRKGTVVKRPVEATEMMG